MPLGRVQLPSEEQVNALAREILERPRYKNFRPDSFDLLRIFGEKWRASMTWLLELHDASPQTYWLLVSALSAACLLLVAHILWTLRAALRAPPPPPPAELRAEESDFARQARTLAARGEPLEAAHRLLLASLRVLAQRRHIPLSPGDGNRAVCRQLAASRLPESLRAQLIALIGETERAWFGASGAKPGPSALGAGADLYRRWHEAYARLAQVSWP